MNSNDLYVSLDIGTSTVKVIIGEMIGESLNIIGVGSVKSNGLRKGSIVDIDETVQSIKKAIEQAERMVGIKISSVLLGIGSNHISLQSCHGVVAVSNQDREISNEDLYRVFDASKVLSIPPEREIVNTIPKYFIVDGVDEIHDPRGMIGVRLEMQGTLITGSKTNLHNMARCVERSGLSIIDFCLQSLGAGEVALSKDERDLGVVLVDMGGGTTTVSYYNEGTLQSTSILHMGSDLLTKDLSTILKTSTEEAERIKLKFGHAFYDTAHKDEVIDVSILGTEERQQFTQAEIADIIEARLEEIFCFVLQELRKMGIREIPSGIVLTGGGASLSGVVELAQAIFQTRARVAVPEFIGVRDPQYTNAVGMIRFAHKYGKLVGEQLSSNFSQEKVDKRPTQKSIKKQKVEEEENSESMSDRMKKVLHYFWD